MLQLDLEKLKQEIHEKDKNINRKELEIQELEESLRAQREGGYSFNDKIDDLAKRIEDIEQAGAE